MFHLLGDVPSPILIGKVSDWTGDLAKAMLLTSVAMAVSGIFYLSAARTLGADTERVRATRWPTREDAVRKALRAVVEALFRVLFDYDCLDEDLLPGERARPWWPRTTPPTSTRSCSRCR